MSDKIYYKVVTRDLHSPYQEMDFTDAVKSGEVIYSEGKPRLCLNGFHACEAKDVMMWDDTGNGRIFAVKLHGRVLTGDEKVAARGIQFLYEVDAHALRRKLGNELKLYWKELRKGNGEKKKVYLERLSKIKPRRKK